MIREYISRRYFLTDSMSIGSLYCVLNALEENEPISVTIFFT